MQVHIQPIDKEKTSWLIPKPPEPHQVGQEHKGTGTPMVNGPLRCSLMSVSLYFRLMMSVNDVGEK